ncbi:MAG: phosphotransferase [Firmicutes bacterium]|nr:phosphotransferase [Bacillota bacterium]
MLQDSNEVFKPGKYFPKDIKIPQKTDIIKVLQAYGIQDCNQITLIDSTHDADDIRLNYILDKKWVIRFCNPSSMTEKRLQDIYRLIDRYRACKIQCPQFISDDQGVFLHQWDYLVCYLSEYIDLPLAWDAELPDKDQLICEVQGSVAKFAERYRNVDLSDTMGMYSLFDLSPFDIPAGIDEKEDNFNQLIALLKEEKEDQLTEKLISRHSEIRKKLKAVYKELPRCVFQGDENFSNILIDEKYHFAGFIDFNLAGTEVIVNQLANLAGFEYDEENKKPIGAGARLEHALNYFKAHMGRILRHYHASELEMKALTWYAWIVMLVQWPTLCYFRDCIHDEVLKNEIIELLSMIAEIPEDHLLRPLCLR